MSREREGSRRRRDGLAAAALVLLAAVPFFCLCAARPQAVPPPLPRIPFPEHDRPCVFSNVERIVAVGDLHGAYDAFIEILTSVGLIDRHLRWMGGKAHLVQMGDVMDRGTKARAILDLLRRLEGEAARAGGAVHMLLGNHEELNILGYSFENKGYVTPEQFRDFLPDWIRKRKDAEFRARTESYAEYNRLWEDYMDGNPQARDLYTNTFNRTYGRWLAGRPIVLKINDIVFVHGGLTEALSVLPCETINTSTSVEIERYLRKEDFDWAWLYQPRGPLWYRDLAQTPEETLRGEVDRILANLKARAIVIGHSPTPGLEMNFRFGRFEGKVRLVDTGIWMKEGGRSAALVIENGEFRMVTIGVSGERT